MPESEIAICQQKNAVLSLPKVTTSADIVAYSLFGDQWSFEVQLSTLISDSSD